MMTRRELILQGIVDALEEVSIANGYATNLSSQSGGGGAQKADAESQRIAQLPSAIVTIPREDKDDQVHNHVDCRLRWAVDVFVALDGVEAIDVLVERAVGDVERALLLQREAGVPLGVAGVLDIRCEGHAKFALDDDSIIGASVEGTVHYRHDLTDPRTFGGAS